MHSEQHVSIKTQDCGYELTRVPVANAQLRAYTEPFLTAMERVAVILGTSVVVAVVQRPVLQLENFDFLLALPSDANYQGRAGSSGGPTSLVGDRATRSALTWQRIKSTQWLRDPLSRGLPLVAESSVLLGAYTFSHDALVAGGRVPFALEGFVAGAVAGVLTTLVLHPYNVLAAAATRPGPKVFTGAFDVLVTALTKKPEVLRGLYRGFGVAAAANALRVSALMGFADATRYHAQAHSGFLQHFFWCYVGAVAATVLHYPLLSLHGQLLARNAQLRPGTRPFTARFLFRDLKRVRGATAVWDGFFQSRPMLRAIPLALLVALHDRWARQATEAWHPERRATVVRLDRQFSGMFGQNVATTYGGPHRRYEFAADNAGSKS